MEAGFSQIQSQLSILASYILKYLIYLIVFVSIDICTPGSYSTTGLSPCTLCPANTYQSSQRSTLCIDCPPGTTAPNGSTNCTGKYVSNTAIEMFYILLCFLYFRGMQKVFYSIAI